MTPTGIFPFAVCDRMADSQIEFLICQECNLAEKFHVNVCACVSVRAICMECYTLLKRDFPNNLRGRVYSLLVKGYL